MRELSYKFIYRDPLRYFEGRGKAPVPWGTDAEKISEVMLEHIKDVGYCVDNETNLKFRWYYCTIKVGE